jgi:hypothetical protein
MVHRIRRAIENRPVQLRAQLEVGRVALRDHRHSHQRIPPGKPSRPAGVGPRTSAGERTSAMQSIVVKILRWTVAPRGQLLCIAGAVSLIINPVNMDRVAISKAVQEPTI